MYLAYGNYARNMSGSQNLAVLPKRSLQNRRDFLRISGEQRRKRGERVASASCVRGEER